MPDTHAEVVIYAAACVDDSGITQIRAIQSWQDLDGIQLDETTQIQPEALSTIKSSLDDVVREEFDPTRAVKRLEGNNIKAGNSQYIIDLLILRSLLKPVNFSDDENFWTYIQGHLDDLINERERLLVTALPVDQLKKIKHNLLIPLTLPQVGQTTDITFPITYIQTAADAGCRLAHRMKEKKANQTVGKIRARVERELLRQVVG